MRFDRMILGPYGTAAVMIAGVFASLIVSAGFSDLENNEGRHAAAWHIYLRGGDSYIVLHIRTFGF